MNSNRIITFAINIIISINTYVMLNFEKKKTIFEPVRHHMSVGNADQRVTLTLTHHHYFAVPHTKDGPKRKYFGGQWTHTHSFRVVVVNSPPKKNTSIIPQVFPTSQATLLLVNINPLPANHNTRKPPQQR